jgi:solute carrier family 13 (sodium-dependent dicarboxylate transporter), member 2/3/5
MSQRGPNEHGVLSEQEQRFENLRQKSGFVLAPLIFLALWFSPITGLDENAHRLLAVLGLVVTLWMTEAVPLPVTALLGPALCVVAGIGSAKQIFANFADPIIFLFLGSFFIAQAMFVHGLNRRIAFLILAHPLVGDSPSRLLLAFGLISGFLSMWISNTATVAMMFPIAMSILSEMARRRAAQTGVELHFTQLAFGTGLMLMTGFGASIGGVATPVGTPPNLIGIALIRQRLEIDIPFFSWMLFALPLSAVLMAFLFFYLKKACPAESGLLESRDWILAEKAKLGRLSRGEINVLGTFLATVTLWILPGIIALFPGGEESAAYQWLRHHLPEAMVALIGATLLFCLPVRWRQREFTLTWNEARRIDWGTILLFGGGLALGDLMFSTGLAKWLGTGLASLTNAQTPFTLIVLFAITGVLLSDLTSNTASATMLTPVAIAVAQAAGVDPLQPALAACLGASMGFMLPVSTPPNAIVYGSGCVPLLKMVRHGIVLDVVSIVAIVIIVTWLVPRVLS